jgi:hypothetical protein
MLIAKTRQRTALALIGEFSPLQAKDIAAGDLKMTVTRPTSGCQDVRHSAGVSRLTIVGASQKRSRVGWQTIVASGRGARPMQFSNSQEGMAP